MTYFFVARGPQSKVGPRKWFKLHQGSYGFWKSRRHNPSASSVVGSIVCYLALFYKNLNRKVEIILFTLALVVPTEITNHVRKFPKCSGLVNVKY